MGGREGKKEEKHQKVIVFFVGIQMAKIQVRSTHVAQLFKLSRKEIDDANRAEFRTREENVCKRLFYQKRIENVIKTNKSDP